MYTTFALLISALVLTVRIVVFRSKFRPAFDLFCLNFVVLIFIPFGIITDHLRNDEYLPYINRFETAMFATPAPILISLLFFVVFLASYFLLVRRAQDVTQIYRDIDYRLPVVYVAAIASVIYLFVGMFINEFPLLKLANIGDESIRDIAFVYASNTERTLAFSPQVFGTVFRIILPFLAFILLLKRRWGWAVVLLLIAALFAIGTLKRMQMIYILLSIFVFIIANTSQKIDRRAIVGLLICVVFGSLMTYLYTPQNFVRGVVGRIFIVEAISEYAVYSYYSVENSPAYFDLFTEKIRKIIDRDVITFSESWKQQIASNDRVRGFAAVGIFAELYLSFWYFGILAVPLFAYFVERIDRSLAVRRNIAFNSIAAVVVATMAIKGFPSQFFTGGLMVLLLAQFSLVVASYAFRFVQRT